MERSKGSFYRTYVKRPLDIIISLISIVVLSPLLLLIALLVKIKLGSPILFKQKRPGLNEKIFTLYKFRTMTNKKDENGELLPDKERLTSLGKLLRSTSLDELPELVNILKGDMSFVGPRPLSVKYLPYYYENERKRHSVRPGLTGLAQVNGRNKATWEERFALDEEYVDKLTFTMDIKVILKTILVVFKRSDIVVRGTGSVGNFHEHRMQQIKESEKNERDRERVLVKSK